MDQPSTVVNQPTGQVVLPTLTNQQENRPSSAKVIAQPIQEGIVDISEPKTAWNMSTFNLIPGIWLAGMLVVTTWLIRSYHLVHRLNSSSTVIDHPDPRSIAKNIAAHYGLKSAIVRESGRTNVPLACGVGRSFVLLPLTWRDWSAEKLELVLLHEGAHIARRDVPIRPVALLLVEPVCLGRHPAIELGARTRL